jgi:hypothetical protein
MRILWLKTELLHPVDKGGKIRTYQMLRAINRKHPITYLTLDDGSAAPDARERALEYASAVETVPFRVTPRGSPRFFGELAANLLSPLAYSLARYEVPAFRERVRAYLASGAIDLVVCDFLTPWVNLPSDAAGFGVPIVLFQHNVEAEIWPRRSGRQPALTLVLRRAARAHGPLRAGRLPCGRSRRGGVRARCADLPRTLRRDECQ